jgi:hypothetical protein
VSDSDPVPRATVGVAVGLVLVLAVAIVVLSKILSSGAETPLTAPTSTPSAGPLALVPVEAPEAGSAPCATLLGRLPAELSSGQKTLRRLTLAEPAPPATRAWGERGGEPVVLRCGLSRPPELTPTSELRVVSGVQWLPIEGDGASTWYLVNRAVYVALTVPAGTGTGALQGISEAVAAALPA